MASQAHIGLADRIEAAIKHLGVSYRHVSVRAGTSDGQLKTMIKRLRTARNPRPSAEVLDSIVRVFRESGIASEWLLTGNGPMLSGETLSETPAPARPQSSGAARTVFDALLRDGHEQAQAYEAIGRVVVSGGGDQLEPLELYRRARNALSPAKPARSR